MRAKTKGPLSLGLDLACWKTIEEQSEMGGGGMDQHSPLTGGGYFWNKPKMGKEQGDGSMEH